MADSGEVVRRLQRRAGVSYSALVPNMKGFNAALEAGCDEIAVIAAASEQFSRKNINCSIAESLERFEPVISAAIQRNVRVRGYVSCALGCPYQGEVLPSAVAEVAAALYRLGCYEISLADTIGAGTPAGVRRMIEAVTKKVPIELLAGHYHDTGGMALQNVYASLEMGMSVFDSSVSGLGGCPYSPGATGNVATEELVGFLHGLDIETGIDLDQVAETARYISRQLALAA
jgi:hydroxymethylglutaryl-CoA lyase